MMRCRFLLMLFMTCFSSGTAMAQGENEVRVQTVLIRFFEAFSNADGAALRTLCTPDFQLLEHGRTWDLDSTLAMLDDAKAPGFSRVNKLEFIRTAVRGKIAYVTYRNFADIAVDGRSRQIRWLESAVLFREGRSRWRISMLHSTPLPAPKPQASSQP